jgi:hypothetical protein
VDTEWEIVGVWSGWRRADRIAASRRGGSARSYTEVMAELTLAGTRLIAVTLPGQAGAAVPKD